MFAVEVFSVNGGQLQRAQGCQRKSISLISSLILHRRPSERDGAVPVVELEPDCPALSTLAAAVSMCGGHLLIYNYKINL